MKLIIDIPEEEYKTGQLVKYFGCYSEKLDSTIYNSTPLEEQPTDITWVVGNNGAKVAFKDMPVDKAQKICAIIGEEARPTDMRDATEEERKSVKDYVDSISKPTGVRFDELISKGDDDEHI